MDAALLVLRDSRASWCSPDLDPAPHIKLALLLHLVLLFLTPVCTSQFMFETVGSCRE